MTSTSDSQTYITFAAGKAVFSIETLRVRYITARDMLDIRPVPTRQGDFREVFDYQGNIITLYSFSGAVGVRPQAEESAELKKLFADCKQDHIDWIDALEHSIRAGEPFTKATDPHQCAFGKWYDNFRPEDEELRTIMEAFDTPHKHIHALAERLLKIAADPACIDEALNELSIARGSTLRELLKLFSSATIRLEDMVKPVVLVLDGGNGLFALEIEGVRDIMEFSGKNRVVDKESSGESAIHDGYFKDADGDLYINILPSNLLEHLERRFPIEVPTTPQETQQPLG